MKRLSIPTLVLALGVLLFVFLSLALFRAPQSLPASAPAEAFSAERAFEHTKMIAQSPHSMATEEHKRVKQYIVEELGRLGLDTSVQSTTAIQNQSEVYAGFVHNVVGIIKGIEGSKALLIVGHYDTKLHTCGAADDGSAVAAMLESARVLRCLPPLKNDIIFLFTDGEESGLFGAKAFVDENRLAAKIGIVLNIEARGSSGPSITYEVSSENGWIMREYAKAVPYPIAPSIAYEIYKLLPNDTDFTVFKEAGFAGFNIGFIDDFVNYHSMTDSKENLSLRSLQHHGSHIVAIASHFGNLDLTNVHARDVVYFNWIGHALILYPIGLNKLFVMLITALLIVVLFLGFRNKRISGLRVLLGILIFALALFAALGVAFILQRGVKLMYPHYSNYFASNFYNVRCYFWAFSAITVAVFTSVYTLFFRKINVDNLLLGVVLVNYGLVFAFLKFIPSGAYLAIFPVLLTLVGLSVCYSANLFDSPKAWAFAIVQLIWIFPIISLLAPLTQMLFVTFGLDTIFVGLALLIILTGYLLMPIYKVHLAGKWLLPIISALVGVVALVFGHFTSGYTKQKPLQSNVSYYYNADTGDCLWASTNLRVDEWNAQFFTHPVVEPLSEIYPEATRNRLKSVAPCVDLVTPELQTLSDSVRGTDRWLRVTLKSNRNAQFGSIYFDRKSIIQELVINGKPIVNEKFYTDTLSKYHAISYFGIYEEGINLWLRCASEGKVKIIFVEKKVGLPTIEGVLPMPEYVIPEKSYESSITVIRKSWEL